MTPLEQFIAEVEISITDAVEGLDDLEMAALYAGVLDLEARLDSVRDAITLLSVRMVADQPSR